MEKIATLLWRPGNLAPQAFADRLLRDVAPRLQGLGARQLKVCVEDDAVAAGAGLRLNPVGPPKAALVSYWIECAQDRGPLEETLGAASASLASYLVVESRPIVNTERRAKPGERSEGFSQVSCIQPRPGISHDAFVHLWHTEQRVCAIETQSTFQYVRNEIVRRLSGTSPPWTAIVEESFPSGALDDPRVFFDAVGDEERFRANLGRMIATVQKFLDLGATDVTAMSEHVFEH